MRSIILNLMGHIIVLEFVLGNHIVGGQVDKIYTVNNQLVIRDYKTGTLKEAYNNRKLKTPFDFVDDSSLGKYSLQLNIYRQMLEDVGINVDRLEIVHFPSDYESYKVIELEKFNVEWTI